MENSELFSNYGWNKIVVWRRKGVAKGAETDSLGKEEIKVKEGKSYHGKWKKYFNVCVWLWACI